MNTTVKSLQDLYVKLGGALTDTYAGIAGGAAVGNYTLIPDMVEAVSKIAENGGGSGLPEVSPADNNKILMVEDGNWELVQKEETLPDVDVEDAGKMLTVDIEGNWIAEHYSETEYAFTINASSTYDGQTETTSYTNDSGVGREAILEALERGEALQMAISDTSDPMLTTVAMLAIIDGTYAYFYVPAVANDAAKTLLLDDSGNITEYSA